MKILIASPHFPPRSIGGVEIYAKRLADVLLSSGDRPEVICVEEVDSNVPGVHIVTDSGFGYPVHRLHANLTASPGPLSATYHSPELQQAIEQQIDAMSPDVLHLHSGYLLGGSVLAAARSRKIPTVVTLHDFWFICSRITLMPPNGVPCTGPDSVAKCAWCLATERRRYRLVDDLTAGRLGRAVIYLQQHGLAMAPLGPDAMEPVAARQAALSEALTLADVILSPSCFLRDQMIHAGVPAGRILVSRYGIEVRPVTRRERPAGDPLRVGYLGQIAPHKGVHLLIEALGQLPAARVTLRIYGDRTPHPKYARRLEDSARGDARISFEGPYVHSAVYDILGDLDVIVVPSVWYENSPFVIQEAQASNVPVIASRLGGMRELIGDEKDGLLFEAGNAVALAHQLRRVIEEPALVERLRPSVSMVRTAEDEMRELRHHYSKLAGASMHASPSLPTDSKNDGHE